MLVVLFSSEVFWSFVGLGAVLPWLARARWRTRIVVFCIALVVGLAKS